MIKLTTLTKIARNVILANPEQKRNRHVAFIIDKNRILSIGFNRLRSHPVANKLPYYYPDIHAELDVCLKFGLNHKESVVDMTNLTLVVLRIRNDGKVGMSKPCNGCQQLIKQVGFKKVYYTNEIGELVSD